jgi:hypothetical protein
MVHRIIKALLRCEPFALSIFLTYLLSSSVGILMAHAGNRIALAQRDKTVQKALASDKASIAYQGWVGGIVSVDSTHRSRLRSIKAASYCFLVLLLLFIPFSLSMGAGVRCGVELYRHYADTSWRLWRYRLPRQSLVDLSCVFAVTVPLFFVASAFEFLSAWNV